MDRCTGPRDITEILLKTVLNTKQSINQSVIHRINPCCTIKGFNDPEEEWELSNVVGKEGNAGHHLISNRLFHVTQATSSYSPDLGMFSKGLPFPQKALVFTCLHHEF